MKRFILSFGMTWVLAVLFTSSCKHHLTIADNIVPVDTTKKDTIKIVVVPTIPTDSTGWKCSADTVYFADVLPIFISQCAQSGCHDAVTRAKNYQLTSYATIVSRGISAGKATSSKVYTEIANGSMPPSGGMPQAQKDLIAKWINQGAKNLTCNANFGACDSTNVKYSDYIQPILQKYCLGCHAGTATAGGGIKLGTFADVKISVQSGAFYGSIAQTGTYSKMPKGGLKLSTCEINRINAWIKRGALNN